MPETSKPQPTATELTSSLSAQPSIGYISLDAHEAYVQDISAGIRAQAAAAGIELVECDSGWTRPGARVCADRLAKAGVHGVISMQPFGDISAELCATLGDVPTVGIVYEQGPCQVSLLQVDQTESGRLAGAALGELAAQRWDCDVRAYVSLESGPDDVIGGARMQGYREGYLEYCDLPKETRRLTDAQHLITAQTQMGAVLDKMKGKPILVAGVSDVAVLGAMAAAGQRGREKELWYSGQLADPAIREVIACDKQYVASVAQFPERFGQTVVPALIDAVEGRAVPARLEAELQLVTSANVRELFPDTPACNK